jgi:hypothetical protein
MFAANGSATRSSAPPRILPALAFAALLTACNSDKPLAPEKRSVTVNLCPELRGNWIVQNQGEPWTQVTASESGKLTFNATQKVSIATVSNRLGMISTHIINTTADELDGTTGAACEIPWEGGPASLSGAVQGLVDEEWVTITAGPLNIGAHVGDPMWSFNGLPNLPLDLVATRFATSSTSPADKIIVRRGVAPNSSSLTLDFASPEARDFENATVSFNNVPTNGTVNLAMRFQTQAGTVHSLGTLSDFESPFAFNYLTVPASLRVPTDYHILDVFASSANADVGIVHLYKAPAPKTFTFGPAVSAPTVTQVATAPYLRLRMQFPKQAEYTSGTSVRFWQDSEIFGPRLVEIITTVGFLDAGAVAWDVTIPDFGMPDVYDAGSGALTAGIAYSWSVTAFEAHPSFLLGGPTTDGATATYSIRTSDGSAPAAARLSSPRATWRPWHVTPTVRSK